MNYKSVASILANNLDRIAARQRCSPASNRQHRGLRLSYCPRFRPARSSASSPPATRRDLIITGPCGVGKSWLACALGHKACKEDLSVLYHRVPRLFAALALARGDGRDAKLLPALGRTKLLILDDWGPETLSPDQAPTCWRSSRTVTTPAPSCSPAKVPVDRHPRSHRPQRLQDRARRREHAQAPHARTHPLDPARQQAGTLWYMGPLASWPVAANQPTPSDHGAEPAALTKQAAEAIMPSTRNGVDTVADIRSEHQPA